MTVSQTASPPPASEPHLAPTTTVENKKRKSRFESNPPDFGEDPSGKLQPPSANKWDMFAEADTPVDKYNASVTSKYYY